MENLSNEKTILDAEFSILNSLRSYQLNHLGIKYDALKRRMIKAFNEAADDDPRKRNLYNMIIDIGDRTDMIFRFLRSTDQGDSASECSKENFNG